jgi:uncharacterized OsmC-like protein
MAVSAIKTRQTGAHAVLARHGQPVLTSVTGGTLEVVTRPSEPGFNPLDLLYASLSACLVLSARIAASERALLDRVDRFEARVTGTKAAEPPSRIAQFHIEMEVEGNLEDAEKDALVAAAENICTVSNTLKGDAVFEIVRV